MGLMVRAQSPEDYPAIAALEHAVLGFPISPADVEQQATDVNPQFTAVVAELDGRLVGRAVAGMMHRYTPAGDLRCSVIVAPDARGRGVGTALWNELQPALQERRPVHLRANGNGSDPASVAWAERRGFRVSHRHLFQALDLTSFDVSPWSARLAELEAAGYRFVPFAQLRSPSAEAMMHRLDHEFSRATPAPEECTYLDFDAWRVWAFDSEGAFPEGWMVLLTPNGDWAGYTFMQRERAGGDVAHIFLTGVTEGYRGKGLSVPLKVAAAVNAARLGIVRMTTLNHVANAPIVAANRTIGFRVEEEIIRLVKECAW